MERGGATVFPVRGGYVKPKKGCAVFWYNLYASGEGKVILFLSFCLFIYFIYLGDYTTRHAGM